MNWDDDAHLAHVFRAMAYKKPWTAIERKILRKNLFK